MKRKDIVTKLVKEGLSEKILANMSDKQLNMLAERLLSEQVGVSIPKVAGTDVKTITALKQQKKPFETYEGDVKEELNNPKLGEEEKKHIDEKESVIKRSNAKIRQAIKDGKSYTDYTKAIKHVNNGKLPTSTENIIKGKDKDLNERSRPGGKNSGIRGGSMGWGKGTKNGKPLKEWVNSIVGKNVHPFTSKNEIMELIQAKLTEQEAEVAEPEIATKLPEFLKFDAIKGAGTAEPSIKPTTKPGTKPTTKPTPKTPYQPGPGPKHNPKAIAEDK